MARKTRGKGLFKPPKHKYLARVITFKDPKSARKAAKTLVNETRKVKRRDAARRRAQALQYAANRARASAKRRNLSPEERRELREIAEIYDEAAKEAWRIYHKRWD